MENTGRLLKGLKLPARRIVFGGTTACDIKEELDVASQVDIAHLIMLAERGLVDRRKACVLLHKIKQLRADDFKAIAGQSTIRGLFMLYEKNLINELGAQVGGVLQMGRSRNDLNATVLKMRLRKPYLRVIRESLKLEAVLLRRARRYADVTMPAYTHYQAAVPITYGHYLCGVASALERDIGGLLMIEEDLNRCPLGAGAVGGTTLPIDPARTASLLGFEQSVLNSVDAVASRDLILRLLSGMAILGVTLSRVSADLLLWTTREFGFILLDDELVGSSSLMPQKRNAFLLEHIKGRSAAATGVFASSVTAMHGTPFTNSIAVGAEAVAQIWEALNKTTESCILTRLVVAGGRPDRAAMLRAAIDGFTVATELANRLVVEGNLDFRSAHHLVGASVRKAIEAGSPPSSLSTLINELEGLSVSTEGLEPDTVAASSLFGGGPGASSLDACLDALAANWSARMKRAQDSARKWRAVESSLEAAMQGLQRGHRR